MTSSSTVSNANNTDELPLPVSSFVKTPSGSVLPRPISSLPSIADSGRISFGAGFRLASK
jgi:hypothetical protein